MNLTKLKEIQQRALNILDAEAEAKEDYKQLLEDFAFAEDIGVSKAKLGKFFKKLHADKLTENAEEAELFEQLKSAL